MRGGELRSVALKRKGKGSLLVGGRILPLPQGVLVASSRDLNILDAKRFIACIREVLNPLAGPEERIAVALPESSGRIVLTETETAFKSQNEGIEVLKWQLKSSFPVDLKDFQIDYQVLERSEAGRFRLVVSLVAKSILTQYEDLLAEAGYSAAVVDFHSLNLYNYYRPRLDLGDDFVLVGIEGGLFSFQYFQGQVLSFHRVKEIEAKAEHFFQELNRSLAGCQEKHPGLRRAAIFLHTDWDDNEPLREAMRASLERDPLLLDPHLERLTQGTLDLASGRGQALVTAIGIAERMM